MLALSLALPAAAAAPSVHRVSPPSAWYGARLDALVPVRGGALAVWSSLRRQSYGGAVFTRLVDRNGRPRGRLFKLTPSTPSTNAGDRGAHAALDSRRGRAMVVWEHNGRGRRDSESEVYGRLVAANGTAAGPIRRLTRVRRNGDEKVDAVPKSVAYDRAGDRFLVTLAVVNARRRAPQITLESLALNGDGRPLGRIHRVLPSAARAAFYIPADFRGSPSAQRISADGARIGRPVRVVPQGYGLALAIAPDRRHILAGWNGALGQGVSVRILGRDARPHGSPRRLDDGSGTVGILALTAVGKRFLATWVKNDGTRAVAYVRWLSATGIPIGAPRQVGTARSIANVFATRWVAAWTGSHNQRSDVYSVGLR